MVDGQMLIQVAIESVKELSSRFRKFLLRVLKICLSPVCYDQSTNDHFRLELGFPVERLTATTSWIIAEAKNSPTKVVFDVAPESPTLNWPRSSGKPFWGRPIEWDKKRKRKRLFDQTQ